MNTKIVLTLTAAVLATAGIFAHEKKAVPSSLYAKRVTGVGSCFIITLSCVPIGFTSSPGTGANQATIKTSNGAQFNIFSTSTCGSGHKVYFHV